MLVKTKGVVLKFIKYKETSIIVNIYTEYHGLQSYIVNGIRSSRSKRNKIALYQPLTLLDLVVYYREGKALQRLSESRCSQPFYTIPLNPKKSAIALFIVEVLSRTLKEQTENRDMFQFIWDSIRQFDAADYAAENFHLMFLIKLTRYLGFNPRNSLEIQNELRDLLDPNWVQSDAAQMLNQMLVCNYLDTPAVGNLQRSEILKVLLSFYRLHVEHFGTMKSVKVLNQVFS